ncbi:MAG TPA: hypothetical protein VKD26_11855 [Streptosporangiaceae bacterium]|nr:hypothetical protein [Streptosporangiaceae bacterium]
MLDEDELRSMTPEERERLARTLAAIAEPDPLEDPRFRFGRGFWLALTVAGCILLAAWIGVLAVTLPRHFTAGAWRGAWVGFDVALLTAFAATAWAAWRRRQVLIVCLIVTATLLSCDAWFDLTLDWRTHEFVWSVLSAFVELPIAALMILAARRLLRLTIRLTMAREGELGPVPPLWRMALFGPDPVVHVVGPQTDDAAHSAAAQPGAAQPGAAQPAAAQPAARAWRRR